LARPTSRAEVATLTESGRSIGIPHLLRARSRYSSSSAARGSRPPISAYAAAVRASEAPLNCQCSARNGPSAESRPASSSRCRRRPCSACQPATTSARSPSSLSSMRPPIARAPRDAAASCAESQSGATTVSASVEAIRPSGRPKDISRAYASSIPTRRACPAPRPGPSSKRSRRTGCCAATSNARASVASVHRSRTSRTSYSSAEIPSCLASAVRQESMSASSLRAGTTTEIRIAGCGGRRGARPGIRVGGLPAR
jgi:hypothetical protein